MSTVTPSQNANYIHYNSIYIIYIKLFHLFLVLYFSSVWVNIRTRDIYYKLTNVANYPRDQNLYVCSPVIAILVRLIPSRGIKACDIHLTLLYDAMPSCNSFLHVFHLVWFLSLNIRSVMCLLVYGVYNV